MKTNSKWYFYEDMGSFYKLVEGELWFAEVEDGAPKNEEGDPVDFDIVAGGFVDFRGEKLVTDRLREIMAELEEKE